MLGFLYSDLAKLYEKVVQFEDGGFIMIVVVIMFFGGDIIYVILDNIGYIIEGQFFLCCDIDIGKVIVDFFWSFFWFKQLVIGKKIWEDYLQVMNLVVCFYVDVVNVCIKLENGFELINYDE